MSTSMSDGGFNLQDLVKKVLLAFCEIHVTYTHRLDIYGSIHVRSDDSDLTCFVLNEHSYKETDVRSNESDGSLTRYVSSINGNSPVETVCHQNSNVSGQVSVSTPNRNSSGQAAETSARVLLSRESNSGYEGHRRLPPKDGKANRATVKVETPSARKRVSSGAADPVSDVDEPFSDVRNAPSITPDSKPQDMSAEAEPWPESTLYPADQQHESHYEQKTASYIKNEEQEDDNLVTVKFEPANESEVIELGSDEEGYDPANEAAAFPYGQSAYDNSGMYPGYSMSSTSHSRSSGYSRAGWMQNSASFQSPDESEQAFAAVNSTINRPPPQRICSYCTKCFTTTVQLRMHVQRYHSADPARAGARTGSRRRQGTSGAGSPGGASDADKRLTCSICLLSFRSLDGLRCHENSKHSRNKVYNCQYCSQFFLTRQAAYTHRTKFHRMKKNESPAAAS